MTSCCGHFDRHRIDAATYRRLHHASRQLLMNTGVVLRPTTTARKGLWVRYDAYSRGIYISATQPIYWYCGFVRRDNIMFNQDPCLDRIKARHEPVMEETLGLPL